MVIDLRKRVQRADATGGRPASRPSLPIPLLAAIALALALFVLSGPDTTRAQTSVTLVSNLSEASAVFRVTVGMASGTRFSQGFHTGDHGGGYQLTGVSVEVITNAFTGAETATFKIYDSETNGTPKDEVYVLTTPAGFTTDNTTGTVIFAAPAGAKLEPDTNYHVVFQATGNLDTELLLDTSASDAQAGVDTNWEIENAYRESESLQTFSNSPVKMAIHGAQNSAATGDPTISGEPRVGLTLAADTGAIMDADGLTNVSYSYQWIREDEDGANPTDITGETGSAYTLTSDDEGKRVRVRVSFTDDNSIPEERTSDAYPATGTVTDDTLVTNLAEARLTSGALGNSTGTRGSQGFHTGDHPGGYRLTGVSVVVDTNVLSAGETATFKIYDSEEDGTPKGEVRGGTLITPANFTTDNTTGRVFFAAPAGVKLDPGENYHVVFQSASDDTVDLRLDATLSDSQTGDANWTIENAYRFNETLWQQASYKIGIHGARNNAATGDPTVSGEPRVGFTLAADTGAIMDADGLTNVSYTYQWIREDEDGTNPTDITDETGSAYTLTDDDDGKRVRVRVSFTDDNSIPEERTSDAYPATGTIEPDTLVTNLAETPSSAANVGLAPGTTVSQRFHTGDHPGGYRLTGVSVVINDNIFSAGETLTLKIYDSESDGTPKDEIYALITPAGLTADNTTGTVFFVAPRARGAKLDPNTNYYVVFQGTGNNGNELKLALTASDDQTGETNWEIEDAYRWSESPADSGNTIKLTIHGAQNNAATGEPVISGDPRVRQTLAADTAAIMDADGLMNVSYSYQWIREDEDGTNPTDIPDATAGTYTLTDDDDGKRVRVRVSFTDDNLIPEERTSDAYPAIGTIAGDTLVTNLAETTSSTTSAVGNSSGTQISQGFHTGDHDGGYRLTGVSVHISVNDFSAGETATFKIYDSEVDGTPKDELYTLVTPTLTAGSTVFFAAPAGAKLDPDTNYHVVFQTTSNLLEDLTLATTDSEDQAGEPNWTIEDDVRFSEDLSGHGLSIKMSIHGAQNNAATGDPAISGDPLVGRTLAADTTSIMDADGLTNVSYTYQWIREDEDGTNPTDITGETASTYTLTDADEGKRVRVRVSFTDDNLVPEERTSEAYPATGTVTDDTLVSNLGETGPATQWVGARDGIERSQGFRTGDQGGGYRLTGVSVHISVNNFSAGETLTLKIYDSESNGTPKDELYILVTPTLTAGSTVFFAAPAGAKLDPNTNYHVVFQGSGSGNSELQLALAGTNDETGEANWTIEDNIRTSGTRSGTVLAFRIGIHGFANSAATGDPTISGEPRVGFTLAADTNAIMDADGLTNVSYTYQWIRVDEDGTNPTPIPNATGSSYTLTSDDEGKRVRVRVSFTDDNLFPEERTSEAYPATGTVIDDTLVSNLAETPDTRIVVGNTTGTEVTQGFHTGDHGGGYRLTGVSVAISSNSFTGAETATFKIYDSESNGTPKDELYTLITPADLTTDNTTGTVFFAAPEGAKLDPDTNYHVAFQGSGDSFFDLSIVDTTSDAQAGEDNWEIENGYRSSLSLLGTSIKMGIHGHLLPPTLVSAVVNGTSLTLEFNRDLDTTAPPASSAFTLTKGSGNDEQTLTGAPSIVGRMVTLTVSPAVTAEDTNIKVDYEKPETNPLKDTFGNEVESFSDEEVTNALATLVRDPTSILVSNAGQGQEEGVAINTRRAQAFTTGYNSTGYAVGGVQVVSTDPEGDEFSMRLCNTGSNANPSTPCTDLTPPDSFAAGTLTFTFPTSLELDTRTTYTVVMRTPGDAGDVSMSGTRSTDEDESSLYGWSIRDGFHIFSSGSWTPVGDIKPFRMTVFGIPKSVPAGSPTAADNTVTATEDVAYAFDAADFSFTAGSSGDTLSKVVIVNLPRRGALTLDGNDVTAGQEVSRADIDADKLTYTSATDGHGDAHATFIFRVAGATLTSADAYRMTIDVTPAQDSPTGLPTFSGSPKAGLVLTVKTDSFDSFKDPDGIDRTTFSYQWMRVDEDGVSNAENIGSNSRRYPLVDADIGRRIKVTVTYTDDLGKQETVTSEAYPSTGTVATITPTYVHWTWEGIPVDGSGNPRFGVGQQFRLLVITARGEITQGSDSDNSGDISDINGLVSTGVSGNSVLAPHSDGFRALASARGIPSSDPPVPSAIARDNTETTGTGVPIYWFKGAKVADDYADLYDGSWDSQTPRDQDGATFGAPRGTWTGTLSDGDISRKPLGSPDVLTWGGPDSRGEELDKGEAEALLGTPGLYGMSPLFEVRNDPPTADNVSVDVSENTDYTFSASDFGFMDTDSEDSLASVSVDSLPASGKGVLELNGTALTSSDLPQTVTSDDLDMGNFVYSPPDDQVGAAFATFNFKVSDGQAESQQYTMTINLVDVTAPTLSSATVNGTAMTLVFSEDLNTTAPALMQFTGKKTPDGGSETALTFTGTPSISTRTVRLTLAAASSVAATDTDVKVTYSKPASDMNPIKDLAGNEADGFTDEPVGNALADSVAPALDSDTMSTLAADGRTLTVTFNEPMRETPAPPASVFTVKATPPGASEITTFAANATVAVNGSTLTLTLPFPIAQVDTGVKVSYANPGSGAVLEDVAGNDLPDFTDLEVTNLSNRPRLKVEALHSDASTIVAWPRWRFTRSPVTGSALDIVIEVEEDDTDYYSVSFSSVSFGANEATETFENGLNYGGNTSGNLTMKIVPQDYYAVSAGDAAATVMVRAQSTGPPITVNFPEATVQVTEGGTATVPVDFTLAAGLVTPRDGHLVGFLAEEEDATVDVDFEEAPDPNDFNRTLQPEDWVLQSNGTRTQRVNLTIPTLEDTEVEANEVFYMKLFVSELDEPILGHYDFEAAGGQTVVVILDDEDFGVSSIAVTSTPTNSFYGDGDDITFEVTFNAEVFVDAGPQLEFLLGNETRQAASEVVEGETSATFTYTVQSTDPEDLDGISWGANAITLGGGAIYIEAKESPVQRDADLDHGSQAALPGHKVDAKAPELVTATVNGTTMTLEFHEDLNTTAPALAQFSGKKTSGATESNLAFTGTPSIVGRVLTLTLAATSSVTATDTDVKVTYSKPTSNPIKDLRGNEADGFMDFEVGNALADSTPPVLDSSTPPTLAADGRTLTITFDDDMRTTSAPAASAFTVKATPQGGSEQTDLATDAVVSVEGKTVKLVLAKPIAHNDTRVRVAYSKPQTGTVLQNQASLDLESFGDQNVTNGSAIPRVSISTSDRDYTPSLADAIFNLSRTNTGDTELPVTLNVTGVVTFTGRSTIPANQATHTAVMFYDGNTSGNMTVTLAEGDGYVPALPPNNSATVQVKVPSSGRYVTVSHRQMSRSVSEGESVDLVVDFVAHEGVAMPRDPIGTLVKTRAGTATQDTDYDQVDASVVVLPADWSRRGQEWVASKSVTIQTTEDLEIEGAETFEAYLENSTDYSTKITFAPGTETATITITDDDVLMATGATVTSTPTNGYYAAGDNIQITVTFNDEVTVDTTNGTPYFEIEVAGSTKQANYSSGTGTTALGFSYTVASGDGDDHDGISWNANPLELNGGTITLMGNASVAAVRTLPAQEPEPGHKVDTVTPTLVVAEFDDDEVYLVYSEDLNTTAPANSAFSVSVAGGTAANPTNVDIADNVVTLTMAGAAGRDQTVTVTYTKPALNPIKDLSGKEANGFPDENAEPASDIENLTASPGKGEVTLRWDRIVDSELTRYQYRYMSSTDTGWSPNWTDVPRSDADTTTITLRGLTNGIEYTFEIRPVYTRSGQTEFGKGDDVKSAPRGDLVAPDGLGAARGGTGQIILSWDDPRDVTITGYEYRYRHATASVWNPDWTAIPGSGPTTMSHTLSGLDWEVLYTFELRTVRGSLEGPAARTQGRPPEDLSRPSVVRELRAVTDEDSEVLLHFRAPARSGDADIATFEYRFAQGDDIPETAGWQEMPAHLVAHRFFFVKELDAGELYTFEVRAVNENGKTGPAAEVQATVCCVSGTAVDPPSQPSEPASASASAGDVYVEMITVDGLRARVAYVDVTVNWDPAVEDGNAVIRYEYRMAKGRSVPSSAPWLRARNDYSNDDELELLLRRLDPGTTYTFEVRTASQHGASTSIARARVTTPRFTGPHYTMSAPRSVREGQALTITVRRTRADGESTALVEIRDTYNNRVGIVAVEFASNATTVTTTTRFTVLDDRQNLADRKLTVRVADASRNGRFDGDTGEGSPIFCTFSVEKHTVNVTNTTP